MTNDQRDHMMGAIVAFGSHAEQKYRAGVKEHGGNLWDNSPLWLLDQAMAECVDQWMYLYTLKQELLLRGEQE